MSQKHYILGAGQVGCLFDFGPEAYDTEADALEGAAFYADAGDGEDDSPTSKDVSDMVSDLKFQGIHYFPKRLRWLGDYIEISEHDGPAPGWDDE